MVWGRVYSVDAAARPVQGCHWRLQGAVPRLFCSWMEQKQRDVIVMLVIPYQRCCARGGPTRIQGSSVTRLAYWRHNTCCCFASKREFVYCLVLCKGLKLKPLMKSWRQVHYQKCGYCQLFITEFLFRKGTIIMLVLKELTSVWLSVLSVINIVTNVFLKLFIFFPRPICSLSLCVDSLEWSSCTMH